jgi:hypothetical protein
MRMPRLRRSGAELRSIRQRVAVEHGDPVEIGRDRFRRSEAAHSRSDDDGMIGDRGWHQSVSLGIVGVRGGNFSGAAFRGKGHAIAVGLFSRQASGARAP